MRIQAARRLSYSSLLILHKCPRLFILQRLEPDKEENIHLSFGSAFGEGFQAIMRGESLEQAIWKAFLGWNIDLLEESPRDRKSFWDCVNFLEMFYKDKDQYFFSRGWKVAQFNGRLATELGARIEFRDGFHYLLFIDCVLINENTGELKVLELKTTKYDEVDESLYANSWQGLLYSVFLDLIAEQYRIQHTFSSYEVLYFVLSTVGRQFHPLPFKKSRLKKAQILLNIDQDIRRIEEYEQIDFPMYGESCYNYASRRPCPKFGICQMSINNIALKSDEVLAIWEPDRRDNAKNIDFVVSADELISKQLEMITSTAKELTDV